MITAQKAQNAGEAAPLTKPRAMRARISDLVRNDRNRADLGDLEMILITLAAIGIFVLSGFHFLGALQLAPRVTLPDVDSTVLASFGIGHGAYLAKKAAPGLGEG